MLLHLTENSPEPMRSQIARQLRGKILTGDLQEGYPLPQAHRVAREHHVSPHEVLRALEELTDEGLLQRDGDAAFRVAVVTSDRRRALAERRLLNDLREQELSLHELELARDIQRRLLPPARVDGHGYTVVSRSFPARFVAGDFYDVLRHADGSVGVVVADVAGKGFGASLVMASVKATTPFIASERGVAETLCELNDRLCAELGRGQFVALAYARLRPASGIVELANAGMPDPFVVRAAGPVTALEVPGPRLPLGIRAGLRYESVVHRLSDDCRLLLLSDGIPEALRPSGEPLGYEGMAGILVRSVVHPARRLPAEGWLDAVLEEAQRVTSSALDDDWTAVVVELGRGADD
jgi:sigma-B regulation protein RsbU (phosphoserine phosphatase)